MCIKYSSFNSANRDDRACCRRFRGVMGVTDSDSVGDVSMRSYLSPGFKGWTTTRREREIARRGISETEIGGPKVYSAKDF